MQKRLKTEGSPYAMFIQLIREHGHNQDVNIELATVIALPPEMIIKLDADNIMLYKDELTVADYLLEHEREITLEGGTRQKATVHEKLKVGDTVFVASLNDKMRYYVIDKAVIL